MRLIYLPIGSSAAAFALFAASPALAQSAPAAEPSVDSYLCTFAGKCGDQTSTEAPTKDAPATKGFRLARGPQEDTGPTKTAPDTKGFRLAKGPQTATPVEDAPATKGFRVAKAPPPAKTAAVPPRRTRAPVAYNKPAPMPAAGSRADLRIAFELGSDRMTPAGAAKARIFAQSLMMPELKGKRFSIEGHTDSIGNADTNLDLSRRRAQAVADFLAAQGVDRSRLEVKGIGSKEPLPGVKSSDPANRRVEAELIS